VPEAITLKVAVCPTITVCGAGCDVIVGACPTALTVKVAVVLVMLPNAFVTCTLNVDPLSAVVVAGVVYDEDVAPLIAAPFLLH
jgi:hypothetical protein